MQHRDLNLKLKLELRRSRQGVRVCSWMLFGAGALKLDKFIALASIKEPPLSEPNFSADDSARTSSKFRIR